MTGRKVSSDRSRASPLPQRLKTTGARARTAALERHLGAIPGAHLAQMLREKYAGVGHRSHLDKRFWISIDLDADVPAKEVRRLVEHSYQLVRAKLTRKQQAELATLETTRATPRRAVR